jgi:putative Mn2+ efflux pump MntP
LISIQTEILVTQSIVYFIAAAIPIYLIFIIKKKIGNDENHFKRLTIVLASFVLMQGLYHVAGSFGYKLLAKGILEPLSFGILIFFGVLYIISKTNAKNEEEARVT